MFRLMLTLVLIALATPAHAQSASAEDRACVQRWQARAYAAHVADAASTIAVIESKRGREVNPLATAVFGKDVSTTEFVAFKAVMVGIQEAVHALALKDGGSRSYRDVCRSYKITVGLMTAGAALNLKVLF